MDKSKYCYIVAATLVIWEEELKNRDTLNEKLLEFHSKGVMNV
jgi:hypothetical protein